MAPLPGHNTGLCEDEAAGTTTQGEWIADANGGAESLRASGDASVRPPFRKAWAMAVVVDPRSHCSGPCRASSPSQSDHDAILTPKLSRKGDKRGLRTQR
eukprot:172163-Rhodomonas_salina.2